MFPVNQQAPNHWQGLIGTPGRVGAEVVVENGVRKAFKRNDSLHLPHEHWVPGRGVSAPQGTLASGFCAEHAGDRGTQWWGGNQQECKAPLPTPMMPPQGTTGSLYSDHAPSTTCEGPGVGAGIC